MLHGARERRRLATDDWRRHRPPRAARPGTPTPHPHTQDAPVSHGHDSSREGSRAIDAGDAPSDKQNVVVQVDLSQYALPVLTANAQELAAHEYLLVQLDKSSGGKTVWRQAQVA